MNVPNCKTIRMFSLRTAFVAVLALTIACTARPATDSEQAPGESGEQNVAPTPAFGTVEVEPGGQLSSTDLTPHKPTDCPDLDSLLFQITEASDPLELAEEWQLKVREGKVQVLLILESEETGFLNDFDVDIGTQSGTQVQAYVPIDRLCDLANTDEVLAIRRPAYAVSE